MSASYWLKREDHITGPYSADQLRSMAAISKISPNDEVSKDKRQWHKAVRVKGLVFGVVQIAEDSERSGTTKRQYWIRRGSKIAGPCSTSKLKRLAEKGLLPREAEISSDRQKWRRVDQIKGLQLHTVQGDERAQPQGAKVASDSSDEQSGKNQYLWRALAFFFCFICEAVLLLLCANSRLLEICYYGFLVIAAFFFFWAVVTLWNKPVSRTMRMCAICFLAFSIPPTLLLYRSYDRYMSFESHKNLTKQEVLRSLGKPTQVLDPAPQGPLWGGTGQIQLSYKIRVYPFKCGWLFVFEGEKLIVSMQILPPALSFF